MPGPWMARRGTRSHQARRVPARRHRSSRTCDHGRTARESPAWSPATAVTEMSTALVELDRVAGGGHDAADHGLDLEGAGVDGRAGVEGGDPHGQRIGGEGDGGGDV